MIAASPTHFSCSSPKSSRLLRSHASTSAALASAVEGVVAVVVGEVAVVDANDVDPCVAVFDVEDDEE